MFASSLLAKVNTSQEFTDRARDEINRKLKLNKPSLRHGPSPLQRVSSMASDSSLTRTASNDSVETITTEKRRGSFFGRLRHRGRQDEDLMMEGDVQSIASDVSEMSTSTQMSDLSHTTNTESVFSAPQTLATQFTNVTTSSFMGYAEPQKPELLTLQQAIPQQFEDMYSPELMVDRSVLIDGRPPFTKRALLDWELNDIRSLLIVESLKREWNGQLPIIFAPQGFKFEYLPLDADDSTIINTLVNSDIYKEAKLDKAFRVQTAKYTLHAARVRHQQHNLMQHHQNHLSKPEWRNVIENFLLNLAVESQCRADFKKKCHELQQWKRRASGVGPMKGSLLKKALLNDVSSQHPHQGHVKLTKEEKAQLWTEVQEKVYTRIGLDWTPDTISA